MPQTDTINAVNTQTIVDTTTSTTIIYIGKAEKGEAASAASWLIKSIDTTSGADIKFASLSYDQIWDNRASLSYT